MRLLAVACLVSIWSGCGQAVPTLPCGSAEGMLIEWTLDGVDGSACWAQTRSDATLDDSDPSRLREEHLLRAAPAIASMPTLGVLPPCSYGPLLLWETELGTGSSGSVLTAPSRREDDVSEVVFEGRISVPGGGECAEVLTPTGGTWRVWEGGTWGEPLLLELRDLTYPTVDGHTLAIRRVLWRGTITPTPVRVRPGVDAGAHDAGTL